ncbi:MAG: peptide chain release factor N(5)-glutamine methyltransferase [Coriobacteriales bacterium]|nr:peptide chain release factor N(5)-glutamine methyltransferase [Coriobacteriales bacterium]
MPTEQWTILDAMAWTEQRLARQGEENPRLAAQMLASHATGLSRIELYTHFDRPLSAEERALLRESIQRRLTSEPLQYIIGSVGFRHLELTVRAPVLIPRPETETLVQLVLDFVARSEAAKPRIVDMGTGSGAIALSLLHELEACEVVATDCDECAVALAEENARELKLDGEERLHLVLDDLAGSLVADAAWHQSCDVVISNPPYVPTVEYEQLPAEIVRFESRLALDGGADGLELYRRVIEQAQILLRSGGLLAVELHENTLTEAARAAHCLPYTDVTVHEDLTGRPRFLTAFRS